MAANRLENRSAFTLLELVVVVAVLVALAGLVLPRLMNVGDYAADQSTKTTLNAVREAMIGADHRPGYLQDMGALPSTVAGLFVAPVGANLYDPVAGRGWHGPYLLDSTGVYHVDPVTGFTTDYGTALDPVPVDGWNHPIILQFPADSVTTDPVQKMLFARLVSAGPDGVIQTPSNVLYPTTNPINQRGDDIVQFLMRADVPPQP